MTDTCPTCGKPIEVGDVKCPACGAELPAPAPPAPPQKAAVLAAAMLPVLFLLIFLLFVGGIIFAGIKIHRLMPKSTADSTPVNLTPIPSPPAPPADNPQPAVAPAIPTAAPPDAAPTPTPSVPATPTPPPPVADAPLPPAPILSDFVPQIAAQGSPMVIRGQGLADVDHVYLISTHGCSKVEADILQKIDGQVIVQVPKIPFENDGICLLITSPGGIAAMLDQHTGATPWGTDGHLHDTAVIVRSEDSIALGNNMLLVARDGSEIAIGDNCTAFLERHVKIKSHGKNCQIYFVDPVDLSDGVSKDGLIEVPSLQVDTDMDAFRVKPAPPDADQ